MTERLTSNTVFLKRTIRSLSVFGLVMIMWSIGSVRVESSDRSPHPKTGETVRELPLRDYRGKEYRLEDLREQKIVVIAFLGTECPLAKQYGRRLQTLTNEYSSRGVAIIGVNSNSQDSISDIANYARQHEIEFPILKDVGNRFADELGARRTPEVFVLDERRVIRYAGAIDDQYGIGYSREKPTKTHLRSAIDELLAGKPISTPVTEAIGCHIGRIPKPGNDGKVTYANQISRIFQKSCVECHRSGEIAPFSLNEYDEVVGWAETIAEVVREERMPPWHAKEGVGAFANDRRLSESDKQLIQQWVDDGAPLGDKSMLPDAATFVSGWQLPKEPDMVLPMAKIAFRVPAEGAIRYQYFRADPGFKEDKWIAAAQLLPGNRSVVHHILVFAINPRDRVGAGVEELEGGRRGFLVGYVPGQIAKPYPQGMAKHVTAGTQLLFQVHYTPNGSEQSDLSKLGLIFADPKSLTHEVRTSSAATRSLSIPPNEANHRVEATSLIRTKDTLLLAMMPHMHVRGKSFSYEAIGSDGKAESLLDIPHYDFNWQTAYGLTSPKSIAAGTRIHCVAHYDNSKRNLNNPDPSRTVHWGEQTWDEMMIGYFDYAIPLGTPAMDTEEVESPGEANRRTQEVLSRFDANKNGTIERSEVPERLRRLFDRLDRDKNGSLDSKELEPLSRLAPGT